MPNDTWTVSSASVGAYQVAPNQLEMPEATWLALNRDMLLPEQQRYLSDDHIFIGHGTLSQPEIGDIRISYHAVPNNLQVTAFGIQRGSELVPYSYQGRERFYRAVAGDRTAAIAKLQNEHDTMTWLLRGLGFLMMWIGLSMLFGPISAMLDLVPFAGDVARWAIGAITGAFAFGLSCVTICVAFLAHNPIALVLSLLVLGGGLALWGMFLSRMTPARR